jgi:hypothetical protein
MRLRDDELEVDFDVSKSVTQRVTSGAAQFHSPASAPMSESRGDIWMLDNVDRR